MIRTGRIYTSKSGERFLILAKKSRPSSNGYDFLGENTRTGLVTYFNHVGKHAVSPDWELKADPYKWLGIQGLTTKGENFEPKEKIEGLEKLTGLLRIENNDPSTAQFVSVKDFEKTYA